MATAAQILAILPQTQCTRCGYPDCAGYAEAIAGAAAPINQCPPGGGEGIARLAALTGTPVVALNPHNGLETPRTLAVIDEDWCIGCTLCIEACPTDAIVGSNKLMHTVIETYCTGCELCVPVCPVDCIALVNVSGTSTGWAAWSAQEATQARQRYAASTARRQREQAETESRLQQEARAKLAGASDQARSEDAEVLARKKAVIDAALQRARTARKPVGDAG